MRLSFPRWIIKLVILVIFLGVCSFIAVIIYNRLSPVVAIQPVLESPEPIQTIIGTSVEGRKIYSYTYGDGPIHIAFVGGIHGGYEWNSVLLAYKFMDYLNTSALNVPENLEVTVIPSLNPDGLYRVIGKEGRFTVLDIPTSTSAVTGRFNSNQVDLNRNFDCKWQPKSTWKGNIVSAGTKAFSEPEAQALQNFVLREKPAAVIFWHSMSNAVYASECKAGILPVTLDIMNHYSLASGYQAIKTFDSYAITGDAEGWLASINIPAITVELKTHEAIEWDKNLAGIKSLFQYFSAKNSAI